MKRYLRCNSFNGFEESEFSREQLQWIKFGEARGIDITQYADPNIPSDEMYNICMELWKDKQQSVPENIKRYLDTLPAKYGTLNFLEEVLGPNYFLDIKYSEVELDQSDRDRYQGMSCYTFWIGFTNKELEPFPFIAFTVKIDDSLPANSAPSNYSERSEYSANAKNAFISSKSNAKVIAELDNMIRKYVTVNLIKKNNKLKELGDPIPLYADLGLLHEDYCDDEGYYTEKFLNELEDVLVNEFNWSDLYASDTASELGRALSKKSFVKFMTEQYLHGGNEKAYSRKSAKDIAQYFYN